MADIDNWCRKYAVRSIALVVVLNVLVLLAWKLWNLGDVRLPLLVSSLFVLIVEICSVVVWRWVAKNHAKMLPSFFTGVSGIRFLLALAVMAVWYLTAERRELMAFFVIFLLFYMVSLTHHSIFFSRVSKRI